MTIPGTAARPRVLLVGPFPPTKGGVTTFMLNLMASPLAGDFAFLPFTTSRPPKKNVTENWGYRSMLRGGVKRILQGILVTLWHAAIFPFVVVWRRVDIVQIQACDYQVFWESALYAMMARLVGRPVVFRIGGAFDIFHGTASPREQRMIAWVLRLPQLVVAQSAFARDYLRGAGRDGDIVLVPNWSRDSNISDQPPPETNRPVCLFIAGTEAKRKGIEEVLAAAGRLDTENCPVAFHLLAVTPGLMDEIKAMGLRNIVGLEGPARHERVLELMRSCEIFLLPSHGEGFPNSLVEAMGNGMASIATPVGAVPEMAAEGGALIVPVGDGAALASTIARLAGDVALRRETSRLALRTVRSYYTASTALPNLGAAYRRLIAGAPADGVIEIGKSA